MIRPYLSGPPRRMWNAFKVGHHADETLEIDLASQLLLKISVGKNKGIFPVWQAARI